MFQRRGSFVGGFLLAPEHHGDAALPIEFDDHVGAFVSDPEVVFFIDFHRVGERPGVKVVADLAQKPAIGVELQKLRSARAVGRASAIATREHEDVSLGIDRHTRHFAEIQIGRKFQQIGHRLILNFGNARWLSEKKTGRGEEKQNQ